MLCLCSYCRPSVNGTQFHLTIWIESFNPQQHGGFLLLFNLTADRFEYVSLSVLLMVLEAVHIPNVLGIVPLSNYTKNGTS